MNFPEKKIGKTYKSTRYVHYALTKLSARSLGNKLVAQLIMNLPILRFLIILFTKTKFKKIQKNIRLTRVFLCFSRGLAA